MSKQISVVIATYNRYHFLRHAIFSVRKELTCIPHEIIVIDGGSTDGTLKWLPFQKDIISIIQNNRGTWKGSHIERRSWGYFINLGFKCAQGKYICMLSDDCLVVPGAIMNGYNLFEQESASGKKVGAEAFFWRNWPDQKEYWVGITLGNKLFVNHGLYLRSALEEIGFADETTYKFYHADGDLCLKLWTNGYECIASPDSYIEHYSHADVKTRKKNLENQHSDWDNYIHKWKGIYDYSPQGPDWITKDYSDPEHTVRYFGLKNYLFSLFRKQLSYNLISKVMGNTSSLIRKVLSYAVSRNLEREPSRGGKRLHLGCGQRYFKGYINIDFPSTNHPVQEKGIADVEHDLLSLTYQKESIDEIRLHHVFEHFPRPVACALIASWHSWLKQGGILHIEVPDLRKTASSLIFKKQSHHYKAIRHLFGSHEADWAVHCEGYAPHTLAFLLRSSGFTITKIRKNNWCGTFNFEVICIKSTPLSKEQLEQAASGYLRNFLINTTGSEEKIHEVWLQSYRKQIEKTFAD